MLNKRVLGILYKACLLFRGDKKKLIIVVKIFLDLHTFMPWFLDGFIGLIIRLLSWQTIPKSPILRRSTYITDPPFFKFCFNKTTPHFFCCLISFTEWVNCAISEALLAGFLLVLWFYITQTNKNTHHTQGSIEWQAHIRIYSGSLLHLIIARNHLLFFEIFLDFVHFCPNFQIFCSFFAHF